MAICVTVRLLHSRDGEFCEVVLVRWPIVQNYDNPMACFLTVKKHGNFSHRVDEVLQMALSRHHTQVMHTQIFLRWNNTSGKSH